MGHHQSCAGLSQCPAHIKERVGRVLSSFILKHLIHTKPSNRRRGFGWPLVSINQTYCRCLLESGDTLERWARAPRCSVCVSLSIAQRALSLTRTPLSYLNQHMYGAALITYSTSRVALLIMTHVSHPFVSRLPRALSALHQAPLFCSQQPSRRRMFPFISSPRPSDPYAPLCLILSPSGVLRSPEGR